MGNNCTGPEQIKWGTVAKAASQKAGFLSSLALLNSLFDFGFPPARPMRGRSNWTAVKTAALETAETSRSGQNQSHVTGLQSKPRSDLRRPIPARATEPDSDQETKGPGPGRARLRRRGQATVGLGGRLSRSSAAAPETAGESRPKTAVDLFKY